MSKVSVEGHIISPSELERFSGIKSWVVDIETTGLYWYKDQVVGVGLLPLHHSFGLFIPVETGLSGQGRLDEMNGYPWPEVRAAVQKLGRTSLAWVGHNIKFDLHWLGWPEKAIAFDTMLLAHLLNENQWKSLEYLEQAYIGTAYKKAWGNRLEKKFKEPTLEIAQYCLLDCVLTRRLFYILWNAIAQYPRLLRLYKKQLIYNRHLLEIEETGLPFDYKEATRSVPLLEEQVAQFEAKLFQELGGSFNWRSSGELSRRLYDPQRFPGIKKPEERGSIRGAKKWTSTATSYFILKEQVHHPLADLLENLRSNEKIKQMTENLIKHSSAEKERLYTSFRPTGTVSGRLSSSEPNLQNVPGKQRSGEAVIRYSHLEGQTDLSANPEYFNLRRLIRAEPGFKIVKFDYKQMEIRMFAIAAKEPRMLEYLLSGKDIHKEAAQAVWGTCDPIHREWAKEISFGLIYGAGRKSLEFRFGLSEEEANDLREKYFGMFPRIKEYLAETVNELQDKHYIEYWSGRRRRVWVPHEYYIAVNSSIQGGCADFLMEAVNNQFAKGCHTPPDCELINLVHDECLYHMREESIEEKLPLIKAEMENADLLGLPFTTDVGVYDNWGEGG